MKRILFLILALALILSACGKVSGAKVEIGESSLYSRMEIMEAVSEVKLYFQKGFEGCTLLNIRYDEAESLKEAADWAEQYNAKDAIVLYSDFFVSGSNPTLNRFSTYENWSWVLVRNGGRWEIMTCGFG